MSVEVTIRNCQRTRAVSSRQLRKLADTLLGELLGIRDGELGIVLLSARDMANLNETFLQHASPTDVITFNYAETAAPGRAPGLHGEIFVCVAEAVEQARRFGTTWMDELARYVTHGVLHLLGYDDARTAKRRTMKREENRRLRELRRIMEFASLAQRSRRR